MDRRESLKSMLLGSVAGGLIINGCDTPAGGEVADVKPEVGQVYGRTPKEKERDDKLMSEKFFDEHELATIAILCDIILPASGDHPSATDVNVPDFVEFIAKDLPAHQLPLRGGIMWIDSYSRSQYDQQFSDLSAEQQISIVDQIAYPDPEDPSLFPGVKFFDRVRNLVLTGYYTSKEGIVALGYKGNVPNVWDGVPQEVLDKHGMSYDEDWMPAFVDQNKRNIKAEWDEDGNLLT